MYMNIEFCISERDGLNEILDRKRRRINIYIQFALNFYLDVVNVDGEIFSHVEECTGETIVSIGAELPNAKRLG